MPSVIFCFRFQIPRNASASDTRALSRLLRLSDKRCNNVLTFSGFQFVWRSFDTATVFATATSWSDLASDTASAYDLIVFASESRVCKWIWSWDCKEIVRGVEIGLIFDVMRFVSSEWKMVEVSVSWDLYVWSFVRDDWRDEAMASLVAVSDGCGVGIVVDPFDGMMGGGGGRGHCWDMEDSWSDLCCSMAMEVWR